MNQFNEILQYEGSTGKLFWKVTRGRCKVGSEAGTVNVHGYIQIKCFGKDYLAHRIIWMMHNDEPLAQEQPLDHINGLKTDNRIGNLRLATIQTNNMNKGAMSNCKTGVRGIYKKDNRFAVEVQGKWVGSFLTMEEASSAYKQKSEELYGNFAPSRGCGHAI